MDNIDYLVDCVNELIRVTSVGFNIFGRGLDIIRIVGRNYDRIVLVNCHNRFVILLSFVGSIVLNCQFYD